MSIVRLTVALIFVTTTFAAPLHTAVSFREFQEEYNKRIVEDGLTGLLVNGELAAAEEYFDENYVQHNPTVPDGRDALVDFFVTNRAPGLTFEIGGIWAEGDFVAVHGRVNGDDFNASITGDIYKVLDGKIVEHWDVVQEERALDLTASGRPMWPASLEDIAPRNPELEQANRRLVINVVNRLFSLSEADVLLEFWAGADYIQHNPDVPDGTDFLYGFLSSTNPGDFTYEISTGIAYGDYVILHGRYGGLMSAVAVDIFRLEDGIIAEHWDILQEEVAPTDSANGNRMFPSTN